MHCIGATISFVGLCVATTGMARGPAPPAEFGSRVDWMTYLGGATHYEQAFDIAVDLRGNSLVTGWTCSTDFDGARNSLHGMIDAYVAKIDPRGQTLWMLYLGGAETDVGNAIAVDGSGNAYVAGFTSSVDFEGRLNEHRGGVDAFVAVVTTDGRLVSVNYAGGTADDLANDIVLDPALNAMIVGTTESGDFVGAINAFRGGQSDAFVARICFKESLQWMKYLGGSGCEEGHGVAFDSTGNVGIVGHTQSADFEGRRNAPHGTQCDAFAVELDAMGVTNWMLYLGGSQTEYAYRIQSDGFDRWVTVGYTESSDFEGRINAHHGGGCDAFIATINPLGGAVWTPPRMMYLGGSGDDYGMDVTIDRSGDAFVTGMTDSMDFTAAVNAYHGGWHDVFVTRIDSAGPVKWTSYFGGSYDDSAMGLARDPQDVVYLAGHTESDDFEGRLNTYHGIWDAMVMRLDPSAVPALRVHADCPKGGPLSVAWEDATPDGYATLLFAMSQGRFVVPKQLPCAGTSMQLGSARLHVVWLGMSDGDGRQKLNATVPRDVCGGYLQLLDLTTCATSNVTRIE